jgi:peptide deformylase
LKGRPVTIEAQDLMARVLQHEIDHLLGYSILDKTDPKSRKNAICEFMEKQDQENT